MGVYLHAKSEVYSIILTGFRQGGGNFTPPPTSKWTPIKPTQIRVKNEALAQVFSCEFCEISKNTFFYRTPQVAASVTYNNTALTWRKGRWNWNGSKQLIFCLENFKLQSWKIKIEKWHEPNNKSKSTGFSRKRIANLLGVFPEVVLCNIDFRGFFDVAFDVHISSIVRFVVDRVTKLVLFVWVAEADDSPAPNLRSSLLSPLLPPPLTLGNSLPNYCVTDGCWFSSISHFDMFTKSINNCTISFGAFSLLIILEYCTGNRLSLLF